MRLGGGGLSLGGVPMGDDWRRCHDFLFRSVSDSLCEAVVRTVEMTSGLFVTSLLSLFLLRESLCLAVTPAGFIFVRMSPFYPPSHLTLTSLCFLLLTVTSLLALRPCNTYSLFYFHLLFNDIS